MKQQRKQKLEPTQMYNKADSVTDGECCDGRCTESQWPYEKVFYHAFDPSDPELECIAVLSLSPKGIQGLNVVLRKGEVSREIHLI